MKTNTKKFVGFGAIGLAVVLGAGMFSFMMNADKQEMADNGQNVVVTPDGGNNYIALMSETIVNEEGYTAQRITATVTPPNATNAILDWSIAWGTETGSWGAGAQGDISNYLAVTPTSDGALVADVTCEAPFGTQAIVTAAVRGYSNISATCTVDFMQRYEGVDVDLSFGDLNWSREAGKDATVDFMQADTANDVYSNYVDSGASFEIKPILSEVYTIGLEYDYESSGVEINSTTTWVDAVCATGFDYPSASGAIENGTNILDTLNLSDLFMGEGNDGVTDEGWNAMRTYLIENASSSMFTFDVTVVFGNADQVTESYEVFFNPATLGQLVGGLTFDKTGIIF